MKTARGGQRGNKFSTHNTAVSCTAYGYFGSPRVAVTAEVASSSLVVPAILSKALAMVLTKPSRTQKGTFQCPFLCPFSVRALLAMSISSRCKVASRGSRCSKYGLNASSLPGGADRGPYSGANPAACMYLRIVLRSRPVNLLMAWMLIPCRCSSFSSCTSLPLNKSRNLLRMEWSPVYHVKGWGKFNRHYGDFCTGADSQTSALHCDPPAPQFGAEESSNIALWSREESRQVNCFAVAKPGHAGGRDRGLERPWGFKNQGFLFTLWMAPKARSDCHLDL